MADFSDEQNTAIQQMIADEVAKATAAQKTEISGLNRTITTLATEKQTAKELAEAADREKLSASTSVEDYKVRVTALETSLKDANAELKTIRFDNAIQSAVGSANIRPELREDMADLLRLRAEYNETAKTTMVKGQTLTEYLEATINSEKGRFWQPASGSSGGGATGAQKDSGPQAKMTKENFNMTAFMNLPKMERDLMIPGLGLDAAQEANLRNIP